MSEQSGETPQEEPQAERGPEGSRDEGSDEPAGGPVDRPEGSIDEESDTSVSPQESQPGAPDMPTGSGG